jgi:hypothetical protein
MMGDCFCGGVAFEFDGPTSNVQVCHCTRCRRATGSAFSAEFRVRTENFRWLRGEDLIAQCDAAILREPPAYRRSFCKTCGSQVPIAFAGSPFVVIPAGLVDDPIEARPLDHIWTSKKLNWLDLVQFGALPQYETEPTSEEQHQALMGPLKPK